MFDLLDPTRRVSGWACDRDDCGGTYPDIEVEVLIIHRLDVEAYRWNGGDDFANLSDEAG